METRAELKTLRNITEVAQSVIFKGRQFVIAGNEEQTLAVEVADAFLAKCSPVIVDVAEDIGNNVIKEEEKKYEWVANMTGDSTYADKIVTKKYSREQHRFVEHEITNPNKAPRTLVRSHKGGHMSYTAKDGGLVQVSLPSQDWKVLPFRRVQMPIAIAEWFVRRDSINEQGGRGSCILSRPQSNFEPDMSWALDDMRVYGRLIKPDMELGQDEGMIADKVKKSVDKVVKAAKAKDKDMDEEQVRIELKAQLKEELRKAKQLLFQKLYFILVDPRYTLPTRKEFNEFVTGKAEDEIDESNLDTILAKAEASMQKKMSGAAAIPSFE